MNDITSYNSQIEIKILFEKNNECEEFSQVTSKKNKLKTKSLLSKTLFNKDLTIINPVTTLFKKNTQSKSNLKVI